MQWMMLQQPQPEDFVIATGVQHSVRDFVDAAARELAITLAWQGSGAGVDLTIRELAQRIATAVGTQAELAWDSSKPDGTPQKLLDVGKLERLGWKASTPLERGLRLAYEDFLRQAAPS